MKRSAFYHFFPPPQFLQMPAVGLDISDAAMRYSELVETRNGMILGRFGEEPIPQGIIESGEVKKPEDLRAVFAKLKTDHGLEFVNVSLPEEKAYSFNMALPPMKLDAVRGAIELALEDNIPLSSQEALFDYSILKDDETGIVVNVSAIPQDLVYGYLAAFEGTGVSPVGFEVETDSLVRAVIPSNDTRTHMIVDFGRTRTGVIIVVGGAVRFTSTIAVGGNLITESVAKTLKVTLEEAEKIKRTQGVSKSDNDELTLAIMSKVATIRSEIARHLAYWNTHEDEAGGKRPPVEQVFLCGGDSNLVGLSEYLSNGLNMPVDIANVMINVNTLEAYVPEISFNDSLRYATAVGLALRRAK